MARFLTKRRAAVASATVALLAVGVAACGRAEEEVASNCPTDPPPVIRDSFPEPEVRQSKNGVLQTTLRASYGGVELAGERYDTMNYEGTVPGPTLVVCPGDRLEVHLKNELGNTPPSIVPRAPGPEYPHAHEATLDDRQSTNIHTHGFHVAPGKNPEGVTSDNIFLDVTPGEEVTYEYEIPEDHPPGAYWYHPHRHGNVEPQIFAGMLGSLIVAGGLDEVPALKDIPVRNVVIHYTQLGRDGKVVPVEKSTDPGTPGAARDDESQLLINGASKPEIPIRPGELQRWRITNANDNPILNLELKGHRFYVLASDGNTLREIAPREALLLGPSERREVLVQGAPTGSYGFRTRAFSQFQGGRTPAARLATVVSAGPEVDDRLPSGIKLSEPEDLAEEEVDQRHDIVFSEAPFGGSSDTKFLVNGKLFDPERVDQRMKLGEVNEWSVKNATTEWHSFHIHVNNFQVTGLSGRAPRNVSDANARDIGVGNYEDTVVLPPGKTVTFRTKPTDFTGKFVFHCHMTNHEDRGMMAVAEVTK